MKVKVINRSEEAHTRERSQDVVKVHRNLDPVLHPMEKAVEYTRALAAGDNPGILLLLVSVCRCRKGRTHTSLRKALPPLPSHRHLPFNSLLPHVQPSWTACLPSPFSPRLPMMTA
jgi:hypothetical protein